ncbi:FAD-dependent oxidoreductase [Celerinatantimonas sp. MCCC 1A17872]|uniref:FAD-dependent oxidoreductase n=1 Tax=Celerinatantimonas sp. MCCC 1A17872 TaxID=3177514 RepID=UPI0038C31494
MQSTENFRIAVVGGGVAGSLCALRLAESGLHVSLLEKGPELVNGPPICHLHAGGSLYRELSDGQCLALLEQSIYTARSFSHSMRYRPTLIAIPKRDPGYIEQLLPRFEKLRAHYRQLVNQDPLNEVIGQVDDYFQLVNQPDAQRLAKLPAVAEPKSAEQWLINALRELDLDKLKFPLVLVQEYGVSLFRVAACVSLAAEKLNSLSVHLNSDVEKVDALEKGWRVHYRQNGQAKSMDVDYLVNAAGFRSGSIDDLLGVESARMVEFKAAYLADWPQEQCPWPEVVIHGQRGTKHGMAQLTPYGQGVFQLHGMAPGVTLFEQGVAKSSAMSAQPQLSAELSLLANGQWSQELASERTQAAINYLAEFVPSFKSAKVIMKPLSGAQQIPGSDLNQRVSGASFAASRYARSEIVKFSSALDAADDILADIGQLIEVPRALSGELTSVTSVAIESIDKLAQKIALRRKFPKALATQC